MTKESARLLISYREAGLEYVSPAKAAPVLGCDPYSLNIAAKAGAMPEGSCYFAGRNLRVSVRWLMTMAGLRPHHQRGRGRREERQAEKEAGQSVFPWLKGPIQISSQGVMQHCPGATEEIAQPQYITVRQKNQALTEKRSV